MKLAYSIRDINTLGRVEIMVGDRTSLIMGKTDSRRFPGKAATSSPCFALDKMCTPGSYNLHANGVELPSTIVSPSSINEYLPFSRRILAIVKLPAFPGKFTRICFDVR